MTKFSFLLNYSCFKWWKRQTLGGYTKLYVEKCVQTAINGNSLLVITAKRKWKFGMVRENSHNCYAEEHKNEEWCFIFLVSIKSCCKWFDSINKDIKHSLSALVTLGNHLVECKTTINVSQIKLSHIILESEQKLHIRRQMSAYESIWAIKWGLIQSLD